LRDEYTRVDVIRGCLDALIIKIEDPLYRRDCYVHYYGVGQAAAMIALKRGHDRAYAELAQIAGMLHDVIKCYDKDCKEHAHRSEAAARAILTEAGIFSKEEINLICHAIYCHSDKERLDGEMEEIIKDADELQHWLRNPLEEYNYRKPRIRKLEKEFELNRA